MESEYMKYHYPAEHFSAADLDRIFTGWIRENPRARMTLDGRPCYDPSAGCYTQQCHNEHHAARLSVGADEDVELILVKALHPLA